MQSTISRSDSENIKRRGAFYTDRKVADFLVRWAIRKPSDKVIDPSFGGGVFLEAAHSRLQELKGAPSRQIFGVEVDEDTFSDTLRRAQTGLGIDGSQLIRSDFFAVRSGFIPYMDALVGNPPFIRFHRFRGPARERALARAREQGVTLSELASSWAAFLVHGAGLLRPGGRMAMVVPYEICHAAYAKTVVDHLLNCFGEVTIVTFRRKLFPGLSENTALLLTDKKGTSNGKFFIQSVEDIESISVNNESPTPPGTSKHEVNYRNVAAHGERLVEHFLSLKARRLYRRLREHPSARSLGSVADVGIGYVTGANDFFHIDPADVAVLGIPYSFLKRAVRRSSAFRGTLFSENDWFKAASCGSAGFLLSISDGRNLPPAITKYLKTGTDIGVPLRYKCRTRSPWFSVPHVYQPDAFLSYMSGDRASLAVNAAGAVAPNTLLNVRFHPLSGVNADKAATAWLTSLGRLSAEIEGHALGGGMLKLEPREAGAVLLPLPSMPAAILADLTCELDRMVREERVFDAEALANEVILVSGMGLTHGDCHVLRDAADELRNRRNFKNA